MTAAGNKKRIILLLLSAFLSVCFTLSALAASDIPYSKLYRRISMDFKDASLKDVLKIFSQQAGLNFVAAKDIEDVNLTLYLDNVTVKQALDNLLSANNLVYDFDSDSNIFLVKKNLLPEIKTLTRVFYLKFAYVPGSGLEQGAGVSTATSAGSSSSAGSGQGTGSSAGSSSAKGGSRSNIVEVIKTVLSEYGRVDVDVRTNSLIITDLPGKFSVIEEVIAKLDVPLPQVMIEVEILDVNKNITDKLGIEWPSSLLELDVTGGDRQTKFPFGDRGSITGSTHFGPSVLSVINAKLALNFLKTQTDTKFLARPRILTLSNETAEIKIATDEAVGVKTTTTSAGGATGSSTAEAERVQTGVVLRVTPQVNLETGEINMFVNPIVSEADIGEQFTVESKSYQYRNPEERSTKSVIRVKDGETVMIGGLIRTRKKDVRKKTFILSDIPILGVLFRSKDISNTDRELVVFLTPHILKDSYMSLSKGLEVSDLAAGKALEQALSKKEALSGRDLEIDKLLQEYEVK
ncbi:MAG: secretin N-terminal domain-containing protein [Candidatus Omnitrophota bacterium]